MSLSASLRGKLGYLKPISTTRKIGGTEFRFYAVRVPMVAELLALSGPIAGAMSTLFASNKDARAVKSHQQTLKMPEGGEQITLDQESPAATLDYVKHREQSHKQAVSDIIDVLVGKDSRNILGRFVADSLRDEFSQGVNYEGFDTDLEEFWNQLDLDKVFQFIAGALEANTHVIRPFLAKVGLNLRGEMENALRERLAPVLKIGSKLSETPPPPSESTTTPSTSAEPSSS